MKLPVRRPFDQCLDARMLDEEYRHAATTGAVDEGVDVVEELFGPVQGFAEETLLNVDDQKGDVVLVCGLLFAS